MSEEKHIYSERVARAIVDKAILYGMPVPKVESMYEYAKRGATESVTKIQWTDEKRRNARYFTLLRNFMEAGLKKYSAKMSDSSKTEIREILMKNRDKLIKGLTKFEPDGYDAFGGVTNI